ncbi:Bax inhibitor-1/YccA family protein [Brevundimonas sp. S30B]|uniref:Bax inhibitor-1/YccA family protein n=1 Tax=unclassified Brevundimonas TaxID=2622653 RepID=UPI001072905D|nr:MULTISPECIES: Bax inhibitor-1/YccA family protein [unclassified Brevundimonas]QBX36457.1 Bax inhibitor-1/YccA family protein [Brevundimonas sp. MF30-B]TFW00709.1 Bax inhibitor-1/YccA family protein [Brevundimonas sp. S30B]
MSDFNNGYARPLPQTADMSVDAGLRAFMLGIYNKLAIGLLVAAGLAYLTGNVPEVQQYLFSLQPDGRVALTPLGMIVQFSPLVMLFGSMFFMKNPTAGGVNLLYWAVVATIGAGLGIVFLRYTGTSVASTFLVTAAAFGGLSLFGYTTKKNLTGMGTFLIMGVIGLIIAMVVNMFIQSGVMYLIISGVGVLLFSGLIAYDTQRLKMTYYALGGDQAAMGVATGFGALSLFINFINLFQFLLAFLGQRE